MAISVVGFDVGNYTCYVAVAKGGGIETIDNEYSDRCTPTCISFDEKTRLIGTAGKLKQLSNVKNSVVNFHRLLGLRFSDPNAVKEMASMPNLFKAIDNDRIGIEVSYCEETEIFTPEQLMAMQLTKLAETTQAQLGSPVVEVVINVPTYFTDTQRRAVLDSSRIAGLNCVRIVNDTTAICIAYGLYNKDLPELDQPPRTVSFVSLGQSSLQVAICSFNKGKMKVIATACDAALGGRNFDEKIYAKMCADFSEKYHISVESSPKAKLRLLQECEKLKKLMSANSTSIPLNIECFMHDKDVVGYMNREEFESLSSDLLQRIEETLILCLSRAEMKPDDVSNVELIGGGTRTPSVKRLISSVFGQEGRTTLNADEAVARGCALQAAICSPSFKVRDFHITDACPYSILLRWDDDRQNANIDKQDNDNSVEVFPMSHAIPCSRQFAFTRLSDFSLEACYTNPNQLPNGNSQLGIFKVTGVIPPTPGEPCTIKVKVRVNSNGVFALTQAQLIGKQVQEEMETEQVVEPSNGAALTTGDADGVPHSNEVASTEPVSVANGAETKKTKKVSKHKELTIVPEIMQYSEQTLMIYTEKESKMSMQDRVEHDRRNSKNSVEEYVYFMREKLTGAYEKFVTPSNAKTLIAQLDETEDWLYGDGENVAKQAYVDRLNTLKSAGDKIQERFREAEQRPFLIEKFKRSIVHIRKILQAVLNGDELYSHLTAVEVETVQKTLTEKEDWFNQEILADHQRPMHEDPHILCVKIDAEREALEAICIPVLSKPKPVVKPPAPEADSSSSNSDSTVAGPKTGHQTQGDLAGGGANNSDATSPKKAQNETDSAELSAVPGKTEHNGDLANTEPMETD